MKILFASRHDLSEEQKQELKGYEVIQKNITWQSIEQVREIVKDYDFLIGVFPQYLAFELGFQFGINHDLELFKIVTAKSEAVTAKEGEQRKFKHLGFYNIIGAQVKF